jgi:gamma-glutamyltranspeptidase/glutathione hydrolase
VARRGFTVDQTFFAQVEAAKDYFDDVPSTRALYLDPGRLAPERRVR